MSGITNEAAIEDHDPTLNAGVEKERLHEHEDAVRGEVEQPDAPGVASTRTAEGGRAKSTLDRVKEAFHRQKLRTEKGV
ncbi:uncharacterized protein N7511_001717 [Penicillium nucicola]|uniref:uncharacterized protein n=1 Tax=Penicillium nucicola TaxID=1850975 RepID=UPI0025453AD6|nr:uncharacterized protein N7511_001717 [Penicillium nucicola]KAJ5776706.1 hypothetical protein N7511_001717 [Penicillium nucicola]